MRRGLLILLGLCSLAAAMVPRERRAVYDEEYLKTTEASIANETDKIICAKHTPCAWSIYDTYTRIIKSEIKNSYCVCDSQSECHLEIDDTTSSAYMYYCRPIENDTTTENTS